MHEIPGAANLHGSLRGRQRRQLVRIALSFGTASRSITLASAEPHGAAIRRQLHDHNGSSDTECGQIAGFEWLAGLGPLLGWCFTTIPTMNVVFVKVPGLRGRDSPTESAELSH